MSTNIFTQHQHFTRGDTFYLVERKSHSVIGPLSDIEFAEHPIVAELSRIVWQKPTNPHLEAALVGQRTFHLSMSAMFVAVLIIPIALISPSWSACHFGPDGR